MDEHFVERDGKGGVVAVDDHGGGVSDEADVDADHVEVDSGGVVVGGDDGDGIAPAVLLPEAGQSHSLVGALGLGTAVHGVLRDVAHAAEEQGRAASGGSGLASGSGNGDKRGHCRERESRWFLVFGKWNCGIFFVLWLLVNMN